MNQEQGWMSRCFQCGKRVDTGILQRRPAVVQTQSVQRLLRVVPVNHITQVVDLCPDCAAQDDAAVAAKQRRDRRLIFGMGLCLLGWGFGGLGGLIGAGVAILLGIYWPRRKKMRLGNRHEAMLSQYDERGKR